MDEFIYSFLFFDLILQIVCFGLIIYIYTSTNVEFSDAIPNNPFLKNITDSFDEIKYLYSTEFKYKNEIFSETFTKKQNILGYNNSIPKLEVFKEKTDNEKCFEYYYLILNKEKISEIFDLNIPNINRFSLGNLIIICIGILFHIFLCVCFGCESEDNPLENKLHIIGMFVIVFLELALLILFWVNYGTSQISEYLDILECPDININSFNDYPVIDRIDDCIISFLVFKTIHIVINIIIGFIFALLNYIGPLVEKPTALYYNDNVPSISVEAIEDSS